MSKTQRPFRRHDRFARQSDVLADNFLIVLAEDKIVDHFTVRSFKAVIVATFRTELEFRFVRIIKKNTIPITAHKERNTLVERIFHYTVTGFVTIPHLIRFATTVHLSCLFSQSEKMLVTTEHFIFRLLCSFTHMPLVGIITKQEFLILIKYLKTQWRFIYPNTQFRSKDLITGCLFVYMNGSYIFQLFINHCERGILPLQLSIGRKPNFDYRRATKL